MKYPEEILRERLEIAEELIKTLTDQRDFLQNRLDMFILDMKEDLWTARKYIDEQISTIIENVEDIEHD